MVIRLDSRSVQVEDIRRHLELGIWWSRLVQAAQIICEAGRNQCCLTTALRAYRWLRDLHKLHCQHRQAHHHKCHPSNRAADHLLGSLVGLNEV